MKKLPFIICIIFLITCNDSNFNNGRNTNSGLDNTADAMETNIMNKDEEALYDVNIVKESFKSTEYDSTELVLDPLKGRASEQITMRNKLIPATPLKTSNIFRPYDQNLTIWEGKKEDLKTEELEIEKIDRPVDILVVMDDSGTMDDVRSAVRT